MQRPEGVTMTAIWFYITAMGCVFGLAALGIGFLGIWTSGEEGRLLGSMGLMIAVLAVVVTGIAHVVVGWGLWSLKPWARSATMVLAIFQTPLVAGIIILIYFAVNKNAKRAFGLDVS